MAHGTVIRDEALRRARALLILDGRIRKAMSNGELAKELNVTKDTIVNEIDWAKRQGLVASFEDQILADLVPQAIKAFKDALANGDTQIALEVLKGTGLLRKPSDKPLITPTSQEDSLEMHIKLIRGSNARDSLNGSAAPLSLSPAGALSLIEGSVLESPALSPETPAETVGEYRDEGSAESDE